MLLDFGATLAAILLPPLATPVMPVATLWLALQHRHCMKVEQGLRGLLSMGEILHSIDLFLRNPNGWTG